MIHQIWSRYVRKGSKDGESPWQLNLVHELHHENGVGGTINKKDEVTALFVCGQLRTLYTGMSSGNVWNWTLPDTSIGEGKKQSIWGT